MQFKKNIYIKNIKLYVLLITEEIKWIFIHAKLFMDYGFIGVGHIRNYCTAKLQCMP